jgi:3'-phosphoadenosine 5'-phosphosulfate sulfotransferase (PAPS reductase)/FAD synthetase
MLRRILDEGLRPDVHVVFANTGKERLETLVFIDHIQHAWNVPVRWVEWQREDPRYKEVTYRTAAREGEPFTALNLWKTYPPTPVMRLCTQHLKIDAMKRFAMSELGLTEWTSVIGIRADEPRRWRILGQDERNKREFKVGPLVEAGITETDVMAFWAMQPFDLYLKQNQGNCDLCFLKGFDKVKNIVRDRPDLAEWWALEEERMGAPFRNDRPSYRAMLNQPDLFKDTVTDDLIDCFCHD